LPTFARTVLHSRAREGRSSTSRAMLSTTRRSLTLKEGIVGEIGTARTDLAPEGKVFVHGELWEAEADGFIPSDAKVKVTRVTGLILKVTKADERIII